MGIKHFARLLIILSPLASLVLPARLAQSAQDPDPFAQTVRPFLEANCTACHNADLRSGGLDLDAFKSAASVNESRERWEKVVHKLRTGEMPPKGMPRPDKTDVERVCRYLESEFARADRLVAPDPGRVTARRLNRNEYNNTVRDLLGVDLRPADDFPQDDSGYGFDNIGDVLSLSPVLMEKYLAAAERVARAAVYGPELLKPTLTRYRGQRVIPRPMPLFDYDLTGLGLPNTVHATHRFPVDGEYIVRAFLGGARPAGSEPLQLCLWVDGQQSKVITFDADRVASFAADRQEFGGMAQDFRIRLAAGDHWLAVSILKLYEGLPADYQGPAPSKRPKPPPPVFRPPPQAPPERVAELRKEFEARLAEHIPANDARVNAVEIGGPYNQAKGPSPASLKLIYACGHTDGHHAPGCARKIIADLAHRAYRRPVTAQEVNQLVSLIGMARKHGDPFEEGVVLAIQAMLVSPHFLFRIERGAQASPQAASAALRLSDYELASRLSYFLWSSMPDDELLRAADQGKLSQPAVLAAEVQRMLKDDKSRALVENFGGQWLELRKLESVKPDRGRFPEFDDYLRISMRRETELFFENVVRQDLSILDFVDGNYSFINERLARFYNITGVAGPEFRKVDLSGSQRGGLLTQASVLTVSSYATRTSPVLRGKWILENLLNAAPPPPPPDVPNLDEAKIGQSASMRVQLEEHRKNPTCASCHARMDPLGFGLENFDAVGQWRTEDGKFPIDASGTLPDGRIFKGPQELRAILRTDRDAFAEALTEKLLTYALGRGLERYDRIAVKKISERLAAENYRFSALVLEIVKSLPFQMRRRD
jgi:mono/diheme cytochrome c family protein